MLNLKEYLTQINKKLSPEFLINLLYYAALIIILAVSIMYRIDVWIKEPGFFGDEGALISNLQTKNIFRLVSGLSEAQCAPPVFMIFSKIIYKFFGLNEFALRFYPVFAGILTLCMIPLLCGKIFKSKYVSLIFVPLVAFHHEITYYSQEFKQYSSDVLFTVILIYLFYCYKDKITEKKNALALGLIFGFCGYFSICAEFIILPMFLYLIWQFLKSKQIKISLYFAIPYLFLLIFQFCIEFVPTLYNGILETWLDKVFAFSSFDEFCQTILFLFGRYCGNLVVCFIITGTIVLLFKNRLLAYLLLCPFVLNIISGLLQLYPFTRSRAILYLSINCLIIFVFFIEYLINKIISTKNLRDFIIIVLGILISGVFYDNRNICHSELPYYYIHSTAREYVNILNKRDVKKDDIIIVDCLGQGVFEIYDKHNKYIENQILYQKPDMPLDVYNDKIYTLNGINKGSNIYIYNSPYYHENEKKILDDWIQNNCDVIYSEDDIFGTFLYLHKKT